ncbi:TetR/AcrR family transcriptional regulator [Kitasatospora sp. MMS16-BH015]|uniref:TetR/AcrR family transcriptional regulator n=1 Tax=Kitasatospora sp. MMS16-BH015 TaxID=2018025 RepID=UPI00131A5880|nr:TetR/AcrR family transcriptional regulator [Kitasatospora sp. MMS16-BH015]
MSGERAAVRRPPGRRGLILQVAGTRFHRYGYHQTSMAEVAAEVGITAPALYRHFRGKPELLRQVLLRELAALRSAARAGAAGPGPLCAELAAAAVDHRGFGTLWQREARLLPAAQRAALRRELRAQVAEAAGVLGAARPQLPREDAELLVWSVLSAYGSLSYHTFAPPRRRFVQLLRGIGEDLLGAELSGLSEDPQPSAGAAESALPESRREELLVAAVRLFHERGFDNVSTDQLGAAVGIAGPSVYKHFATKAELLAAALVRSRERLWQEVVGAVTAGGLEAGLRAYVDFARRHSHYLGAMLSETERLAEPDRRVAVDFRRDFLRVWVGSLQRARPEFDSAEARIRVHAMFALVNDGVRNRPHSLRPELGECLVLLGRTVLGVPRPVDREIAGG